MLCPCYRGLSLVARQLDAEGTEMWREQVSVLRRCVQRKHRLLTNRTQSAVIAAPVDDACLTERVIASRYDLERWAHKTYRTFRHLALNLLSTFNIIITTSYLPYDTNTLRYFVGPSIAHTVCIVSMFRKCIQRRGFLSIIIIGCILCLRRGSFCRFTAVFFGGERLDGERLDGERLDGERDLERDIEPPVSCCLNLFISLDDTGRPRIRLIAVGEIARGMMWTMSFEEEINLNKKSFEVRKLKCVGYSRVCAQTMVSIDVSACVVPSWGASVAARRHRCNHLNTARDNVDCDESMCGIPLRQHIDVHSCVTCSLMFAVATAVFCGNVAISGVLLMLIYLHTLIVVMLLMMFLARLCQRPVSSPDPNVVCQSV